MIAFPPIGSYLFLFSESFFSLVLPLALSHGLARPPLACVGSFRRPTELTTEHNATPAQSLDHQHTLRSVSSDFDSLFLAITITSSLPWLIFSPPVSRPLFARYGNFVVVVINLFLLLQNTVWRRIFIHLAHWCLFYF
jgi:hypothetical protein